MQAAALSREQAAVAETWGNARRIILVHTMGKVGSMAISHALRAHTEPDVAIFHTHRLIDIDDPIAIAEREGLAPRKTWFTSSAILKLLHTTPKPLSVVTVARDPFDRNISGFFQTLERYTDDGRPLRPGAKPPSAQHLAKLFVDRYPHSAITTWLDREITRHFGVDIYGTPFEPKVGWMRAKKGEIDVVVARFDRLADIAPEMLSSISDRPVSVLERKNTSESKHIGPLVMQVRDVMEFPEEIERELYGSRYSEHFGFSPAVIGKDPR